MEHITTTSRPDFTVLRLSADEELVNAITHGIGLALAAVGSLVMMTGVTAQRQSLGLPSGAQPTCSHWWPFTR